jgi:hypothetical protein
MKKHYNKSVKHHMSISVGGVLAQFTRKKIRFCSESDGTPMAPEKAKQIFLMAQYEGKRVLPMNADCTRFCYQKGCPGHALSLKPTDEVLEKIDFQYKQLGTIPEWKTTK